MYIPGNSDLRCKKTRETIKHKASSCKNTIKNTLVFAINDCTGVISDKQLSALSDVDKNSIVFVHHPFATPGKCYEKLRELLKENNETTFFYAHNHRFGIDGNCVSLPAMDPDKATGESPCIIYYDTITREFGKSHYASNIPIDLHDFFGISCYNTIDDIKFAIDNGLKCFGKIPEDISIGLIKDFTAEKMKLKQNCRY